jgi:signal transduction histidine kinase
MILTTLVDISLRKSIELQRDQAVEGARIGVWDWELRTGKIAWSERCNILFELPPHTNITYEVFLNAIAPADRDRVENAVKHALEKRHPYEIEMRVPLRDRKVRWILCQGRAVYDTQGRAVRMSGIAMDVTERKRLEDEREKAIQSRDDVIAIVSHDLKNPLSSIDLNANLLIRQASTCDRPESIAKTGETIRHSASHMVNLINNLLEVSKIEAGHLTIEPKAETLGSLVKDAMVIMKPMADAKRIHIKEDMSCSDARVFCDREKVGQVFSNIIGNAIKFTPEGGRVSVECDKRDNFVLISVADNGPGIARDELPHVFDRFWQAKRAGKAGVGLGLAIAKGIVQAHGGDVSVASKPREGTTFYFTLPTVLRKSA